MDRAVIANSPRFATATHSALRGILLLGVIVSELLVASLRFDSKTMIADMCVWADLAGRLNIVVQLGVAAAVGIVLFGGSVTSISPSRNEASHSRWWLFLLAHTCSFGVWYALSIRVFERRMTDGDHSAIWLCAWTTTGVISFGSWFAAWVPPSQWRPFIMARRNLFAVAALVAIIAVGVGQATATLWNPLGGLTLSAVQALAACIYGDALRCDFSRFRVSTDRFWIEIAPSCSGYEGIGLILAFLIAYSWFNRRLLRFPRALMLLPIGVALIWMANVLRITGLFLLGQSRPEIALAGFHSQAGWLAFNAVSLGLLAAVQHSRFFCKHPDEHMDVASHSTAIPYVAPLFTLLLGTMITHALTAGFDRYYVLRLILPAMLLASFWPRYSLTPWAFSWTPIAVGFVVYSIWIALEPSSSSTTETSPFAQLGPSRSVVWLVFRLVGSIVVIPLVEEIAFRGYLTRRLISRQVDDVPSGQFTWLSLVMSSVLFGCLHSRWLAGTLAGLLFALALYRRRRLADAVLAHMVANGLLAMHVITQGEWRLWA